MTGNATMTRRATGCLKKVAPEKKVFGHFLYGLKQCCMFRAYRCAALDTPLAYIRKKLTLGPQAPRPLGPFSGHQPDFGPKIRFLL